MSELTIITNHHVRPVLYWHDLTEREQSNLCQYDNIQDSLFCRYKGRVYDLLGEFLATNHFGIEWDYYMGDSYFSGVLYKWADDNDFVIVGTYIS